MIKRPHFILASASPRRLQLLQQTGLVPDEVIPPDIDETPHKTESPDKYALRIAEAKAALVSAKYPDAFVLAADTVVACGRRILPKAEDEKTAAKCLQLLSGRRHRVYTAVCARHGGKKQTRLVMTQLRFKRLGEQDIKNYIATNEWQGKAGGYAIQGCAEMFVPWISGSYSNVIGLPLAETCHMLEQMGAGRPEGRRAFSPAPCEGQQTRNGSI